MPRSASPGPRPPVAQPFDDPGFLPDAGRPSGFRPAVQTEAGADPAWASLAPCPRVSVVVANHNGGAFIEDALASAARQSVRDIEIIVVDDGSTDDSVARVRRMAAADARIRLIDTGARAGPGGARNQALAVARGTWIAVLDSDDIMHPRRLAGLMEAAGADGVEIVADNQLVFDHAGAVPARPLLAKRQLPAGFVTPADYIDSNRLFSGGTPLDYLKPLFRRSFMEHAGCRYDPALPIAEDYDLVLRLLLAGARFRVCPQMTYFYRRHGGSISHRLSVRTLEPMLAADDRLRVAAGREPLAGAVVAALDRRRETIRRALGFEALVGSLKAARWRDALRIAAGAPSVAALLRVPLGDRLRRAVRRRAVPPDPQPARPRVSLLSRQRIVGSTNGSSAYLLGLCGTLKEAGYAVDLISPSPAMFGRWPVLRLDPAIDVFDRVRIRGAMRLGRLVVARDPRIALRAAAGVADRLLRRARIAVPGLGAKAPHAIAVPLTDRDRLFIAGAARRSALILADYAFLNEAIPFALQPRAPSAVVMHDLFFAQDRSRTVVRIDQQAEMALLDQADAVIAIQAEEAGTIERLLPGKPVILAPMAVRPVAAAQPGDDGTLLFVGSNTLPNLDGIGWFLREVWPQLLERFPAARLAIAGSCCGGLSGPMRNVALLGRVQDLADAYRRAGIVISPLRLGSGLKIKLVEALGHGKATVATRTTLQGVGELAGSAVLQADTAPEFLTALAALLHDRAARARIGAEALAAARRHFSAEACYGGLLGFVAAGPAGLPVPEKVPSR